MMAHRVAKSCCSWGVIFLAASCYSTVAWALDDLDGQLFTPPATDLSIQFLGKVFGTVDAALFAGDGSALMGLLFEAYNYALLTAGAMILMYNTFLGALHTANEGVLFGEKIGKQLGFLSLRTILGLAFLVPKSNGYTILQGIVMWIAVSGVAVADNILYAALDYFQAGGSLLAEQPDQNKALYEKVDGVVLNVLRNMSCVASYREKALLDAQNPSLPSGQSDAGKLFAMFDLATVKNSKHMVWGSMPPDSGDSRSASSYECGYSSYQDSDPWIEAGLRNAVTSAGIRLEGVAADIVQNPGAGNLDDYVRQLEAARDAYISSMRAALGSVNGAPGQSGDPLGKFHQNMRERGWIVAGNYYNLYMSASDTITEAITDEIKSVSAKNDYPVCGGNDASCSQIPNTMQKLSLLLAGSRDGVSADDDFFTRDLDTGDSSVAIAGGIAQAFGLNAAGNFIPDIQDSLIDGRHPLLTIAATGRNFMRDVDGLMISAIVFSFVGGLASGTCQATNPFGAALGGLGSAIAPFITIFAALKFTIGMMMGIHAPMIPMIIFAFGGLGWIALVLEAMIAAPVVALGMLASEGGDFTGRAGPAVFILSHVFLRPSMMLIGFFGGMLVSYVVLSLLNEGAAHLLDEGLVASTSIYGSIGFGLVYANLTITAVQKSFDLIHLMPDRIMRWVGDTTQSGFGFEGQSVGESASQTGQAAGASQAQGEKAVGAAKGVGGRGGKVVRKVGQGSGVAGGEGGRTGA